MRYSGLYPVTSTHHVKIDRMTMNCTTKAELHNHVKKLLLICMANVFT
jgi:hypothetical protein